MTYPLCSVLIPVYNEEWNIKICFDSLCSQTYENIEVIFIDDGSTDASSTVIDELIIHHPEMVIKKLYQENKGAAKARSLGIDNATGSYIAFLDCDDFISPDAIELAMLGFLNNHTNDIDLSLFNLNYSDINKKKETPFIFYTDNPLINGFDAFRNSISTWGIHGLGIYRKELLIKSYSCYEKIKTDDANNLNNDEIITRLSFFLARNIFISKGIYYYVNNLNSTTKKVNENAHKTIRNAMLLHEFIYQNIPEHDDCISESMALLSSTTWDVSKKYFLWRNSKLDKKAWRKSIKMGAWLFFTKNRFNLNNISSVKLYLKMALSYMMVIIRQ